MRRIAATALLLGLPVVFLAACGQTRRPGTTTVVPKPKDSGVFEIPDLGVSIPDVGTVACACDLITGSCDQGCFCDVACAVGVDGGTNPGTDASTQSCGTNPNGCVLHQVINPTTCACQPQCDVGYLWSGTSCVVSGGPDGGVVNVADGGFPTSDPFNAQTIADGLATALCDRQDRCAPFVAASGANTATCEADYRTTALPTFNAMKQAIDAQRIGFRQSQFSACLSLLATADCDVGIPPGSACDQWTYGTGQLGAGCTFDDECATGLYCEYTSNGFCGTCQPRVAAGESCQSAGCLENLECMTVIVDQQGTRDDICLPAAGENQTCGDVANGLCSGNLQCSGAAAPYHCARPVSTQGATCDPQNGPSCSFERNLVCGTGNTCVTINWNAAGGSCASNSPVDYCRSGLLCSGAQNAETCSALPAQGQPCPDNYCADGLYCSNGSCTPLKTAGQTCTGLECADGLVCQNGVCGTFSWSRCAP
ncbi:MAG: hypothetical protein HYV07_04490 [Deltaproteobacteria bacterium]|nr:hypothetical protein [Deltaproteobacteria bacterium]